MRGLARRPALSWDEWVRTGFAPVWEFPALLRAAVSASFRERFIADHPENGPERIVELDRVLSGVRTGLLIGAPTAALAATLTALVRRDPLGVWLGAGLMAAAAGGVIGAMPAGLFGHGGDGARNPAFPWTRGDRLPAAVIAAVRAEAGWNAPAEAIEALYRLAERRALKPDDVSTVVRLPKEKKKRLLTRERVASLIDAVAAAASRPSPTELAERPAAAPRPAFTGPTALLGVDRGPFLARLVEFGVYDRAELGFRFTQLARMLETGHAAPLTDGERLAFVRLAALLGVEERLRAIGVQADDLAFAPGTTVSTSEDVNERFSLGYEVPVGRVWSALDGRAIERIAARPEIGLRTRGVTVLDLMGGNGAALERMRPAFRDSRLVLADAHPANIRHAVDLLGRRGDSNRVEARLADVRRGFDGIPFPDGGVDVLLSVGDWEFGLSRQDLQNVLREVGRALKHDGGVWILQSARASRILSVLSELEDDPAFAGVRLTDHPQSAELHVIRFDAVREPTDALERLAATLQPRIDAEVGRFVEHPGSPLLSVRVEGPGVPVPVALHLSERLWRQLPPAAREAIRRAASWQDRPDNSRVEGRTVTVRFEAPVVVDGERLAGVEIKGIAWRNGDGRVEPPIMESYHGRGRPSQRLAVDRFGRVVNVAEEDRPKGSMRLARAENEWRMMDAMSAAGLPTDVPIGYGEFLDRTFPTEEGPVRVGFVVRGVRRLNRYRMLQAWTNEVRHVLEQASAAARAPAPQRAALMQRAAESLTRLRRWNRGLYWRYGRLLRLIHDRGFVLDSYSPDNVVIDPDGIVIKDLDLARPKAGLTRDAAALIQLDDLSDAWTPIMVHLRDSGLSELIEPVEMMSFWEGYFFDGTADLRRAIETNPYNYLNGEATRVPIARATAYLPRLIYSLTGDLPSASLPETPPPPLPDVREISRARAIEEVARHEGGAYPVTIALTPDETPRTIGMSSVALARTIETSDVRTFLHGGFLHVLPPSHPLVATFEREIADRAARWDDVMGERPTDLAPADDAAPAVEIEGVRPARLTYDPAAWAAIRAADPEALRKAERVIGSDFETLQLGRDYDQLSGGRSVLIRLARPLLIAGWRIGFLKVKGIRFDVRGARAFNPVVMADEAGLLAPEERGRTAYSYQIGEDGRARVAALDTPERGIRHEQAVEEFENSAYLAARGVWAPVAVGVAEYAAHRTASGDPYGAVVLGLPDPTPARSQDALNGLLADFQAGLRGAASPGAREDWTRRFVQGALALYVHQGALLRALVDVDYIHIQLHGANWGFSDPHDFIEDNEGGLIRSRATEAQFFGTLLLALKNSAASADRLNNLPNFPVAGLPFAMAVVSGFFNRPAAADLAEHFSLVQMRTLLDAARLWPAIEIPHPAIVTLAGALGLADPRRRPGSRAGAAAADLFDALGHSPELYTAFSDNDFADVHGWIPLADAERRDVFARWSAAAGLSPSDVAAVTGPLERFLSAARAARRPAAASGGPVSAAAPASAVAAAVAPDATDRIIDRLRADVPVYVSRWIGREDVARWAAAPDADLAAEVARFIDAHRDAIAASLPFGSPERFAQPIADAVRAARGPDLGADAQSEEDEQFDYFQWAAGAAVIAAALTHLGGWGGPLFSFAAGASTGLVVFVVAAAFGLAHRFVLSHDERIREYLRSTPPELSLYFNVARQELANGLRGAITEFDPDVRSYRDYLWKKFWTFGVFTVVAAALISAGLDGAVQAAAQHTALPGWIPTPVLTAIVSFFAANEADTALHKWSNRVDRWKGLLPSQGSANRAFRRAAGNAPNRDPHANSALQRALAGVPMDLGVRALDGSPEAPVRTTLIVLDDALASALDGGMAARLARSAGPTVIVAPTAALERRARGARWRRAWGGRAQIVHLSVTAAGGDMTVPALQTWVESIVGGLAERGIDVRTDALNVVLSDRRLSTGDPRGITARWLVTLVRTATAAAVVDLDAVLRAARRTRDAA